MLENSGPYHGRGEVPPNMRAPINISKNINANVTPVNMTKPIRSAPIIYDSMNISSHMNNVNSHFVHQINSPLNMSSINMLHYSSRMNGIAGNSEEIIRQPNPSNSSALNLNFPHMAINRNLMSNQSITPFNYYSNPMNSGFSSMYNNTHMPMNDVSTVQDVEKTIIDVTNENFEENDATVDENLNTEHNTSNEIVEESYFKNNGCDETLTQINANKNPFINDVHGVTKEHFESKYNIIKFTLVDASSSYDVATKLVAEDKTDPQKIFQCQHCNLLFKNAKRFVIHCKWHTFGILKYTRKQHNEEAKTRKKNTKTDSKETKMSEEVGNLEDVEEQIRCELCKQIYPSKLSLRNHMRRVHSGIPKDCPICHKSFHNQTYLKSHMTTHTEERKFMCDECPKTFKFVHSLMRHRPTHLKEKNFTCSTCDKSFGSRLLLKIHSKTHERTVRGTEFRCTYCGKGFYHAYTLVIHERTHTGEKPFKCDICHSAYGTNSSLQRHLKVSHNNDSKPFACTICQRAFSTDAMLDRHYLRCHPEPEGKTVRCQSCSEMFHSQSQCDTHINKVHSKQDAEPQRRRRRNKVPQVIGHTCP